MIDCATSYVLDLLLLNLPIEGFIGGSPTRNMYMFRTESAFHTELDSV